MNNNNNLEHHSPWGLFWKLIQVLGFPSAGEPVQPVPSGRPATPPAEPKPSKRLIILAECKWLSDADRNHVLKKLCEAMAMDQLNRPFWIRKYLISPISQTQEESGADSCIQYKIHISRPQQDQEQPAQPENQKETNRQQVARICGPPLPGSNPTMPCVTCSISCDSAAVSVDNTMTDL